MIRVPVESLVRKFEHVRFEHSGMTRKPEIPFAKSLPDYIFRCGFATREGGQWRALRPPRQLPFIWKSRPGVDRLWWRIWHEPPMR